MSKTEHKSPGRFALLIFILLVIFCLAQLTWWLVFQIQRSEDIRHLQQELWQVQKGQVAMTLNRTFDRLIEVVNRSPEINSMNFSTTRSYLDSLVGHPMIGGYRMTGFEYDNVYIGGEPDSTFVYRVNNRINIFLDKKYIVNYLFKFHPELALAEDARINITNPQFVADMFEVKKDYIDKLDSDTDSQVIMFVSEGSFFMLIVLFGAFLIFRSLIRSEDLKYQQQHFIQAMTHELRTPLTSLKLYLQNLQSGKINENKGREIYGRMLDDCDSLDSMVDNILTAGKFGRDEYKLKLSRTNFSEDLGEYLKDMENLIRQRNGKIETKLQPDIHVRTDYHAMKQVVRMLVDNALKYSPESERSIVIALSKNGRQAQLSVTDKGYGIPGSEQQKIFDQFYRVNDDQTRKVKGTGLGLYLVREIVLAHGGSVKVVSEGTGQGSEFVINLPVN